MSHSLFYAYRYLRSQCPSDARGQGEGRPLVHDIRADSKDVSPRQFPRHPRPSACALDVIVCFPRSGIVFFCARSSMLWLLSFGQVYLPPCLNDLVYLEGEARQIRARCRQPRPTSFMSCHDAECQVFAPTVTECCCRGFPGLQSSLP